MIFLVDIDGTVADLAHRLHHIEQSHKNWRAFFADCIYDRPIDDVIDLVKDLSACGHTLVFVSGRSDEVRQETEQWLAKHDIPFDGLFMRKKGDRRQDNIVKSEILDDIFEKYGKKIAGVFDDRQQVVDMYRNRGLRVYQVAKGDF
jgi:uncharacterized HAD superfamily protein